MKCQWKHNYTGFLRVFSHGLVMATVLKATGMSSPLRRDYSIAGSKIVLTARDDRMYINAMSVLGWLRQITGLYIHEARQAGDEMSWNKVCGNSVPLQVLSSASLKF
jgi:hypothetical protein